jgi:hypothetical protein
MGVVMAVVVVPVGMVMAVVVVPVGMVMAVVVIVVPLWVLLSCFLSGFSDTDRISRFAASACFAHLANCFILQEEI